MLAFFNIMKGEVKMFTVYTSSKLGSPAKRMLTISCLSLNAVMKYKSGENYIIDRMDHHAILCYLLLDHIMDERFVF